MGTVRETTGPVRSERGRDDSACSGGDASKMFLSARPMEQARRLLLPEGTKLGRFEIRRHLGSGSLGEVYIAHDSVMDCDVAMKTVCLGPADDGPCAEQLRREMAAYRRIRDHRHVLKIYGLHLVPWEGVAFLVLSMEYADGGSLRDWLHAHGSDAAMRQREGLEILKQICRGLRAAHEAGVAHRDLKPANILQVEGVWKIADLGLSGPLHALAGDAPVAGSAGTDLDKPWTGTPAYMSPEQFHASYPDEMDGRSDLYSAGVVAFEMFHPGARPPYAGTYDRLRELHCQAPVPSLPEVDPGLAAVVRRCMAKNPDERFQSAQELLAHLEGTAGFEASMDPSSNSLLQEAAQLVGQGQLNEAGGLCDRLLAENPADRMASQLRNAIQERWETASRLYAVIAENLEQGSLEELGALLTEAIQTYPDHPEGVAVQVRLEVKARRYRQTMDQVAERVSQGDWEETARLLEQALTLNPGAEEPMRAARFARDILQQIQGGRALIDREVEAGNWQEAQALARSLDAEIERISTSVARDGGPNHEDD
jgi:serine/threonine protein kinase